MITRIDNGNVWTNSQLQQLSILVSGGKIAGLLASEKASLISADEVIDAQGSWILPGGIDLHVHISDGIETFYPGSCCAAVGGVTTVLDMAPIHGCVKTDQFVEKIKLGQASSVVDFGLIAGIVTSEEDLDQLSRLAELGAAYFKVFMPSEPPVSTTTLWKAVQVAAHIGLRLALHAEDVSFFKSINNLTDPLGFAHSRPAIAETSAVAQVLEMARAAGAPIHICHVSTARAAELIANAKAHGVDVTAEVAFHHLLFDENAFVKFGSRVKTTPPLRTKTDTEALWQALSDGIIDVLVSDHYIESLEPRSLDPTKIAAAYSGIGGLEVSLPLIYYAGVVQGKMTLERFVAVTSARPAEIARLKLKGKINLGAFADLTFWKPYETWQLTNQGPFSHCETTPYYKWKIVGKVVHTMVRGKMVWDGEKIVANPGWGRWLNCK
jgi:dihydroorotase (multifunctional complex type)